MPMPEYWTAENARPIEHRPVTTRRMCYRCGVAFRTADSSSVLCRGCYVNELKPWSYVRHSKARVIEDEEKPVRKPARRKPVKKRKATIPKVTPKKDPRPTAWDKILDPVLST